jgi:hypothetical protein
MAKAALSNKWVALSEAGDVQILPFGKGKTEGIMHKNQRLIFS